MALGRRFDIEPPSDFPTFMSHAGLVSQAQRCITRSRRWPADGRRYQERAERNVGLPGRCVDRVVGAPVDGECRVRRKMSNVS